MIFSIIVVILAVVLDQVSKYLSVEYLMDIDTFPLIKDILHFTYLENRGAAFGMLANNRWVFMIISVIGILALSIYLFRFCKESKPIKIGLALVISGGIGNMIDRTFLGFVVDMLQLTFLGDFFPWVFNIADSMVCIGIGLVIAWLIKEIIDDSLKKKREKSLKMFAGIRKSSTFASLLKLETSGV